MGVLEKELAGGVLTLKLNRPESLNALNQELLARLREAFADVAADAAIRAVVLTGVGRGFCPGQDLNELGRGESLAETLRSRYNPVIRAILELDKPVIAAINGVAAGAGLSLALACDVRVAAAEALFITAFTRIGLVADSGMSFLLPRVVGWGKAFELLALSPSLTADQALHLGIVNRVVPGERLLGEVRLLAEELACGPTKAYGLIKRELRKSVTATLEDVLEYEAWLQELASRTEDYQEGLRAFREKRQPAFSGQ